MRKSIFILTFVFLLSSCSEFNNPFTDIDLNKRIKSQTKLSANPETNTINHTVYEKNFDEDGRLTSVIYFNEESRKVAKSSFEYNYNEKSEIYVEFDEMGDTSNVIEKEYLLNENGQVLKIEIYDNGVLKERSDINYNADGNISQEKILREDGKVEEKNYEYDYNKQGDLEVIYIKDDENGKIIQKDSLIYSDNKLDLISFDNEGKISQVHQINYDENGLIKNEKKVDSEGKVKELFIYQYTFYK